MKSQPDAEDEHISVAGHADPHANRLTPVLRLPPDVAAAVVAEVAEVVRKAHRQEAEPGEIRRTQQFEEGRVYLLEAPFDGFFADRYLMDLDDTRDNGLCARMHLHTGLRLVRLMTGPDTTVRVSSLTEIKVLPSAGWQGPLPMAFTDDLPGEVAVARHNVVVPENAWVDLQIPRGVSHQFNADGPHAVIDSVHPEESVETLREDMSGYAMAAQTIFLTEQRDQAAHCLADES